MTAHVNGIVISVMLAVPDAPAAAAWYQRALGDRVARTPSRNSG